MYVPSHFKEAETEKLQQYIRDYSFGILVVADAAGIEANHIPFYLITGSSGRLGYLHCHLARSNTVWERMNSGSRALAVFQGPNAYVSPSWYPTKKETGRVVPTWNYLAIHAEGTARIIQDPEWLRRHLVQLTDENESRVGTRWSVNDAPQEFTDRLIESIVGVEIEITALTGKLKASQNQPERNRIGVKTGLEEVEGTNSREMAKFIPVP